MINRKKFFDIIRQSMFNGNFSQGQVNGIDTILNEWESRKLIDIRYLAYMFTTVKWETAHTMQPIAEYGRGQGHIYGIPDTVTGETYYGRGFVQLTWKDNYIKMSRLLGVDLVNNPDLTLNMIIATQILFEGMLDANSGVGDFTNKALDEYFNDEIDDPVGARKIINGTDHDREIAELFYKFYYALSRANV